MSGVAEYYLLDNGEQRSIDSDIVGLAAGISVVTERLTLIPVSHKYVEDITKYFTPQVTQYMYPSAAESIEHITRVVGKWMQERIDGSDYVFAVTDRYNEEFLGVCGLHSISRDIAELGIWIKIAAHGHHYGREAVGGLISLAESMGLPRLLYPVDRRNVASRRIPEYYRGTLDGEWRAVSAEDGKILEVIDYIISIK